MKRFTSQKFLLLISSFCLLLFLVSCDVLMDELTSDTETDSAIIDSVADTTSEISTMLDPSVSETEEVPTEEEASEEPSYEESTREPTVDTSEEPTDEATTASAETSAEEITEEITEETTEEPTEEPTTCTDEYPQDVVDQLAAEGDDVEKLVFERGPDLHFQYKVVVNKRILRHGEQLAVSAVHCVSGNRIIDFYWLVEYLGHSPIKITRPPAFTKSLSRSTVVPLMVSSAGTTMTS